MKNFFCLLLLSTLSVACQPVETKQPEPGKAAEATAPGMNAALLELFGREVLVAKMHLFAAAADGGADTSFAYFGKPISGELAASLDASMQATEAGGVFACYQLTGGKFFVLRIPGKNPSGDLALARWDGAAGKLVKVTDLAWRHCNASACHQQDAWLADLDDDRKFELVTRSRSADLKGKVSEEAFSVMTEDGKGGFVKASEQIGSLAVKGNYVLHQ